MTRAGLASLAPLLSLVVAVPRRKITSRR